MAKKMLSLLLALCMTVTMLAGCGSKEEAEAPAAEEAAEEATAEEAELEPVELKWWVVKDANSEGEDEVEEAVNAYLAEALPNTTVDISFMTIGDHKEKLTKALASGEVIDVAWFGWNQNQEDMVAMGAMTEMDDLLAEYGQGIVDSLGETVVDMHRASDGKAYFLPAWQGLVGSRFGLLMPQKFVDIMGEAWADEFQTVLYEADAAPYWETEKKLAATAKLEELFAKLEEEGIANGGMNLRGAASGSLSGYIFGNGNSYEKIADYAKIELIDDTYYVEGKYAENGYWYNLNKVTHDWYEKGYIREDAASYDWDATDMSINGSLPETEWFVAGGNDARMNNEGEIRTASYGYDTACFHIEENNTLEQGFATGVFIPSTTENPERAMMLLNILYTDPTMHRLLSYGIEGTNYTLDDKGVVVPVEGSEYVGVYNWTVGTCEHSLPTSESEIGYYDALKELEKTAEPNPVLGFSFVHTDETTLIKSNMDAAVAQYEGVSNAIRPTDEYWADARQAALDNGYEDLFNEIVSQLTTYAETLGRKVEVRGF